jgi:hypothetical protein
MSINYCKAIDCKSTCAPKNLLCGLHWGTLSRAKKEELLAHFHSAQLHTKKPSLQWQIAAIEAIQEVAIKEGKSLDTPKKNLLEQLYSTSRFLAGAA